MIQRAATSLGKTVNLRPARGLRALAGFTLVEIMTVMAIISVLVSMGMVEGIHFRKEANESNCLANLKTIASGFEIYAARHFGLYAPEKESSLKYLIDERCLYQDLVSMGQLGNFRYVIGSIDQSGYDIRAMAVNPALADHNFQIVTGAIMRRSDSPTANDTDFKSY